MPTPYKVFLSVPDEPSYQEFLGAARTAIWRMDQMMISALGATDIVQTGEDRLTLAKQAMETTALFVGIYGANYGTIPDGASFSYAEQEYRLASQRGLVCAIFMTEDSKQTTDERVKHFKEYLETSHIINYFKNSDELQAKVILSIDKFLKTNHQARLLPPIQLLVPSNIENFAPAVASKATPDTIISEPTVPDNAPKTSVSKAVDVPMNLETLVNESLKFASDDIEQIMRRVLQVWDAQKTVQTQQALEGWLKINPIFGVPLQQSQFHADIFMIMPFREQFNTVYENVVRPVVGSLNLTMKRGDDFTSVTGSIMQEVWAAINACQVVIVETTEVNANVYYELGIAHTLGKPAVLITQAKEVEDIPFDVRHLRFIRYENTIAGGDKLADDLKHAIVWILNDLKERETGTNG